MVSFVTYQTPKTMADVVRHIERRRYLLPAIQREFVWKREQIEELFDSLMRGYPIGSFLFWELQAGAIDDYQLYDFVADYDERSPHNEAAEIIGEEHVIAILDGQQRLSAMNIALRGSYTQKVPRLRRDNPLAWVKRELRLCLLHANDDAAPDESMYEFQFKSDAEATSDQQAGSHFWLRLKDVLQFRHDSLDHEQPLIAAGIDANPIARRNAYLLTQLVHRHPCVSYYLESEDDLDKVLNIFIRVNRGGTKLSYSDLLMSVATARWRERDAREAVHDLVDQLNATGEGFAFGRDRVLKGALVVADLPDVRLKARNMLDSMLTVEAQWEAIERSLLMGARILAHFGLSRDSLTAENALIPVAYYAHRRRLSESYLSAPAEADDRERLRSWVIRSLLRAGFWTGAVDVILLEARRVIQDEAAEGFPASQLEKALEAKNKSLRFTEGELEDLLATPYASARCVPLLSLMYGDAVRRQAFHTDHVYPRARLRIREMRRALQDSGRDPATTREWLDRANQLPNLQLLTATENTTKGDLLPVEWARLHLPDSSRDLRLADGDLAPLPTRAEEFFDWYESRRALQESRLRHVLGLAAEEA